MAQLKNYLLSILLAIAAVLAPIKSTLLVALSLIALDLILGLLAARKQKLPITSSGLKRTIIKLVVYEMAIALAYLASMLTGPLIPLVNIVGSFVALTELKSCMENLNILGGGSLLQALIDKLNQQQ